MHSPSGVQFIKGPTRCNRPCEHHDHHQQLQQQDDDTLERAGSSQNHGIAASRSPETIGLSQMPSSRALPAPASLPAPSRPTGGSSSISTARNQPGMPPAAYKQVRPSDRPWAPSRHFHYDPRHVLFLPKNAERNRPAIPIEWHKGQALPSGFKEQLDRLSDDQRQQVVTHLGGVIRELMDGTNDKDDVTPSSEKQPAPSLERSGSVLEFFSFGGSPDKAPVERQGSVLDFFSFGGSPPEKAPADAPAKVPAVPPKVETPPPKPPPKPPSKSASKSPSKSGSKSPSRSKSPPKKATTPSLKTVVTPPPKSNSAAAAGAGLEPAAKQHPAQESIPELEEFVSDPALAPPLPEAAAPAPSVAVDWAPPRPATPVEVPSSDFEQQRVPSLAEVYAKSWLEHHAKPWIAQHVQPVLEQHVQPWLDQHVRPWVARCNEGTEVAADRSESAARAAAEPAAATPESGATVTAELTFEDPSGFIVPAERLAPDKLPETTPAAEERPRPSSNAADSAGEEAAIQAHPPVTTTVSKPSSALAALPATAPVHMPVHVPVHLHASAQAPEVALLPSAPPPASPVPALVVPVGKVSLPTLQDSQAHTPADKAAETTDERETRWKQERLAGGKPLLGNTAVAARDDRSPSAYVA